MSLTIKNTFLNFDETASRHRRTISVPSSVYFNEMPQRSADILVEQKNLLCPSIASTASRFSMSSASSSVGSDVSSPPQSTARQSGATTVMIRNIPCKYTQENVMEEVSAVTQNYDFLYMPPARGDGGSKGYAFVNFCDEETASRFLDEFQGHAFYRQPNSLKRAEVVYAEVQGLMQNVKFYKRCKAIKTKFRPYINKAALKTAKK